VDTAAPVRRVVAAVAAGAVLVGALASCSTLNAATALPGQRPGVDVPSRLPVEAADQPLGRPALAPSGAGGFTFRASHPDGTPVTFDPCRPVHVVVRPDGEPPGGRALLLSVLGELSAATGLHFLDDGVTDEAPDAQRSPYPPGRDGDPWAPVLGAWTSPAET
jgi:hypothetical protein